MSPQRPRRRALALVPAACLAWVLVVGLPLAPRAGSPGHLDSTTEVLTGPKAVAVPAATGATTRSAEGPARRATGTVGPGWSAAVDLAAGSQMVAVTWVDDASARGAAVSVRSRHDGVWSAWQPGDVEDGGPDAGGNGRTGAGPIWLGHLGADRVELRVDAGHLRDVSLLKMRWTDPTPGAGGQAHAEYAGPTIKPRSAWAPGGWVKNPGCTAAPIAMKQISFAVVHHTVNANDYTQSQVPGILAGIYRYHTQSMGWCDIAYNFLVDRFGQAWQGRSGDIDQAVMGGHAKGFNSDSVGIALLGQFEPGAVPAAVKPSTAMITTLESVLAWKLSIHGIDPLGSVSVVSNGSPKYPAGKRVTIPTIIGHRDVGLTDCPGGNVYSLLPTIRTAVAKLISSALTPAKWAPFSTPRAIGAQQYRDFLGREGTNGEVATFASDLQRNGITPAQEITTLLESDAFAKGTAPIVRLYLAYFLRIPDHGGLAYWLGRFHAGTSLDKASDAFAASSEFVRTYGSLDDAAFVDRVYRNVLGRPGDTGGVDYWTTQLDQHARTRGAVMTGFSESAEYTRATGTKVAVDMIYEAMLGHAPSGGSYLQWLSRIGSGSTVADLAAQAFTGGEYAARIRSLPADPTLSAAPPTTTPDPTVPDPGAPTGN